MSLPYFKNYVNDYLAGSIMSCDAETQGIFTMICMLYWKKDCQLIYEPDKLARRFRVDKQNLEIAVEILKDDVLTVDESGNFVIKFLDEQFVEMSELSKKNSENGRLSAQKRTVVQRSFNGRSTVVNHTDTDTDTEDKENIYNKEILEAAEKIFKLHPRQSMPNDSKIDIIAAIQNYFDKPPVKTIQQAIEYIKARTELYASIVKQWPLEQKKYIGSSNNWYAAGCYTEDENEWKHRIGEKNGNGTKHIEPIATDISKRTIPIAADFQ